MAKENYLTYDVVEENNPYGVDANAIAVTALTRGETSHITKDFGAGHLDFTLGALFEMDIASIVGTNPTLYGFGISNTLGNVQNDHWSTKINSIWVGAQEIANNLTYFLFVINASGTFAIDRTGTLGLGTRYYFTFTRSGSTPIVKIYDDAARTNLVDTLTSASANTDTFRQIYAANSSDQGVGGDIITGEINNLELLDEPAAGGVVPPAVFQAGVL